MLIVFIGSDGSGKTSVANALSSKLSNKFKKVRYFHTRFGIVSNTGLGLLARKFFGKKDALHDANLRQKDGFYDYPEPHSAFKASMILAYVSIDYLLGYFIANKFTKNSTLLIFDRYFYEFFTEDPFKNQPMWMLKFYKLILPKPNLVVFLYNDPKVIFKRKPEQSIEQIREKNERNQKIIDSFSYGVCIKTDDSVEEIATEIETRILNIIS